MANRKIDDQLQSQVKALKDNCESSMSGLLSETLVNFQMYNGELPKPMFVGDNSYVDRIIYRHVEGAVSQLMPIFTSNKKKAVVFNPLTKEDISHADALTKWVSDKLLIDNNGKQVIYNAIQSSLINRISWVKTDYVSYEEGNTQRFHNFTKEDLVKLKETSDDVISNRQSDGTYRGHAIKYTTKYKTHIDNIPLNQMLFPTNVRNTTEIEVIGQKQTMFLKELEDMFGSNKVKDLGVSGVESITPQETMPDYTSQDTFDWETNDEKMKQYVVYEMYFKTTIPSKGRSTQWVQCFMVNNVMLEWEIVESHPYSAFVPIPLPNQLIGSSIPDLLCKVQNNLTALNRSLITNNQSIAYPRFWYTQDADASALVNNVAGQAVKVKNRDSVGILPDNILPSDAYNFIGSLEQQAAKITGVSDMNMGLDPNVFKETSTATAVVTQMNAGSKKIYGYARNLANGWEDVVRKFYDNLKDFCQDTDIVYVDGEEFIIEAHKLVDRKTSLSAVFGQDECIEKAQQLLMMGDRLKGTKGYDEYVLNQEVCRLLGLDNYKLFMKDPASIQPTQQEMYLQQAQMDAVNLDNQTKAANIQVLSSTAQKNMSDTAMEAQRIALENQRLLGDQDKMAEDVMTDRMKLEIESHKVGLDDTKFKTEAEIEAYKLNFEEQKFQHQMTKDLANSLLTDIEIGLETTQARPVKIGNE